MKFYQERVFDIIDSFSIFNGSVIELAKGLFMDSHIDSMYPTNIALCCLNIANEEMGDNTLKEHWTDILTVFYKSDVRKRKPTLGRKLYRNIISNSDELRNTIDIEKNRKITEVMFSGSKIGYSEGLLSQTH